MNLSRVKKILKKAVPLWLTLIIVLDTSLIFGAGQYYLTKIEIEKAIKSLSQTTKNSDELVQILKQEVLPVNGYKTSIKWKDLGGQLVEAGVIDRAKFQESFTLEADGKDHMKYLGGSWDDPIEISEKNSRFMVDTLWALGLLNKSKVLDEGEMKKNGETANFASTGGWTLGAYDPMTYYSSVDLLKLTDRQQELVKKIAENVFRPCCPNATSFPDCNHGMAALGYIELAVKNGLSEKQIYKDLLSFNSFWFPQNYVELAAYFKNQNLKWDKVDPKLALSSEYSSSLGMKKVQQKVQDLPLFDNNQGGGCSA